MTDLAPETPRSQQSGSRPRNGLVAELRGAAVSLTFLTRLPIGLALPLDGDDLARSAPYFPVVGTAVGGVIAGVAVGVSRGAGPLLAAVVAVACGAALTGALHLDGVADTFDALGTRTREAALRVMQEPTIGSFGATALFLDLALWTALLATLVGRPSFVADVVVVAAWARLGPVLLLAAVPYVRPEGGLGSALSRGSRARAAVAVAVAVVIGVVVLGPASLVIASVMVLTVAVLAASFRRWLGGVTGDSLGCSIEVLGLVGLSVAVGLAFTGGVR